MVVSLRNGVFEPARRPPANSIPPHSPVSAVRVFCCRRSRVHCSDVRVGLSSWIKKYLEQIQEGIESMSFVPTATAVLNQWVRILAALEKKINRQSYETWLKPTRFSHIAGKTLYVRIPSAEFQHLGEKYADLIQEAIDNLALDIDTVTFTTPAQDPSAPRVREDGGFAPVSSHNSNAPHSRRSSGPAAPAPEDQLRQMMQTLLADRFKLAFHRESKEMQAYII